MSARVALLRMHREGVITLPPARKRPGPRKPIAPSPQTDPPSLFKPPTSLDAVRPLRIEPVATRAEGRLWNAFVDRYHYLGHHPLPGAQMRYFVHAANGETLAVLGFAAAAWKTAPRDAFIGWSPAQRQRNLPPRGQQRPLPHRALDPHPQSRLPPPRTTPAPPPSRLATPLRPASGPDRDLLRDPALPSVPAINRPTGCAWDTPKAAASSTCTAKRPCR